ncbi:uncharacterized protein LOC116196064 isoform X2 [Punica granatum]|uniref:Uncharacterized protein LOC116196064 isoform X2 n=1 Tax=Punica granatum TaxID=22663 RepID=A0A6P8CC54_PUNGR|nr:uncharacterized protein LOC116196064 isoform X2 [Punica granatum]
MATFSSSATTALFTASFDPANPFDFLKKVFKFLASTSDFLSTETADDVISAAVEAARRTAAMESAERMRAADADVAAAEVKGEEKSSWRDSGRANKRDRRVWTAEEENSLFDALEDLIGRGMRAENGFFKPGYMSMVERALEAKCPGSGLKCNPHIESKMKNLKKLYHLIADIREQSGLGWDSERNCILIDCEDSWQAYCQKEPHAAVLRGRLFPHYDRLDFIFGKSRGRGNGSSEDIAEVNDKVDQEKLVVHENDIPTRVVYELDARQPQQKRLRTTDDKSIPDIPEIAKMFDALLERVDEGFNEIASCTGHGKDLDEDKRRVGNELLQMGISIELCIPLARRILKDSDNLHLFYGFKGENRRAFVNSLLQDMGKRAFLL